MSEKMSEGTVLATGDVELAPVELAPVSPAPSTTEPRLVGEYFYIAFCPKGI